VTEKRDLRDAYAQALLDLGALRPDVVVLDADGARTHRTELFGRAYPGRFYDLGLAEQNVVGAAAGLATCGKVPFATMFANFAALRACEQIKTLVSYPRLNVKIVGGYAGVSDGPDGPTHHCLMDVAVMRSLPNLTVVVPADAASARAAVLLAAEHDGPVYLRLSYGRFTERHGAGAGLALGAGITLAEGGDVTLLTSGPVLDATLAARAQLAAQGIAARVVELWCVKPLDEVLVLWAARETGALVTVEEHSVVGGLGSAVAELAGEHCPVPVERVGFADRHLESAPYDYLVEHYGPNTGAIVAAAERAVARKWRTAP
jgi:transketolase